MSDLNMVLQKRLEYGSSGHQVPAMPRVPKSARGKRSARKKVEENQMCAFDLLATVAGKLLQEEESLPSPNYKTEACNHFNVKDYIKQEQLDTEKPIKLEPFDQGSCNESTVGSEVGFGRQPGHAFKELPQTSKESSDGKSDVKVKTPLQSEQTKMGKPSDGSSPEMYTSEDQMEVDLKPPTFVSSDSSVEVPLRGERIPHTSFFPMSRGDVKLGRDDDENSSGSTHPSTITAKATRPQRIGGHRIRKLLASKHWKANPKMLKDGELSNIGAGTDTMFRSRKLCYTRQRTERSACKRRKLFEHRSIPEFERGIGGKSTTISPEKGGIKVEKRDSSATLCGGNGTLFSSTGQRPSYESGDCHVKLSIKSFKVPELFIEIPETATVGSLKRTVMEAVTAILGGGLRVGVLFQGKKVRDDSKTLLQAGLSHGDKHDNFGFTLEPNPTQPPPPLTSSQEPQFLLPRDSAEPLTRIPATAPVSDLKLPDASPEPPLTLIANCPESDHDSVHSPTNASSQDKMSADSRALVPVPDMDAEALAVVPLRKARRSELVQRRIRRPFSVSEVEALVQAVEKIGTGRWRDVKLRAFDDAKHRTYVDLKDKWKTLVHTARISPQQRRGEPVPQELLDRVLSAHAYWSQQQAKLQVKSPPAETCLL